MDTASIVVVTAAAHAARTAIEGYRSLAGRRAAAARHAVGREAVRSEPRRLAANLETFFCDGVPVACGARIAAARGFAEGTGFLPGQIVDRAI
jgi:hypothetical protein